MPRPYVKVATKSVLTLASLSEIVQDRIYALVDKRDSADLDANHLLRCGPHELLLRGHRRPRNCTGRDLRERTSIHGTPPHAIIR